MVCVLGQKLWEMQFIMSSKRRLYDNNIAVFLVAICLFVSCRYLNY